MIRKDSLFFGCNLRYKIFEKGYNIFNDRIKPNLNTLTNLGDFLKVNKNTQHLHKKYKAIGENHKVYISFLINLKDNLMNFISQ